MMQHNCWMMHTQDVHEIHSCTFYVSFIQSKLSSSPNCRCMEKGSTSLGLRQGFEMFGLSNSQEVCWHQAISSLPPCFRGPLPKSLLLTLVVFRKYCLDTITRHGILWD